MIFTFVEFAYGYTSNSLGLISDSFHMLFDSTAIALGLYANFMAKNPPTDKYPFGLYRFETISGYVNALFLVIVAVHIFVESLERVIEQPYVDADSIIFVSILGLIINLIGLAFFHEFSHGGHGCSHDHGHGKKHHGHSHGHSHSHSHNIE